MGNVRFQKFRPNFFHHEHSPKWPQKTICKIWSHASPFKYDLFNFHQPPLFGAFQDTLFEHLVILENPFQIRRQCVDYNAFP